MSHQPAIDGEPRRRVRGSHRTRIKLDELACAIRRNSFDEAESQRRLSPARVDAGVRYQRGLASQTQFQTTIERLEPHCGSPPTKTLIRKVELWLAEESQPNDSRINAQLIANLSKGFVNRLRFASGISFHPVPYICDRCSVLTLAAPLLDKFLQRRTLGTSPHPLRSELNE